MTDRIFEQLAQSYCRLLVSLDWSDQVMVCGIQEGLRKFLSNAYMTLLPGRQKYYKTQWVSERALTKLKARERGSLVFEHIVPKEKFIQVPCKELAMAGTLTADIVRALLLKYWQLATITKDEDRRLPRDMPETWDATRVFARYESVGIVLVRNPYFPI